MTDRGSSDRPRLFCRKCGTPVRPEDTFCSYCGENLEAEAGDSAASQRTAATSRIPVSDRLSRLWPANAGREILTGVLVAVAVAVLTLGLVYALLALRGAFTDPSVPRTLGLVVFSLIHGGALWASVPAGPSLLGIGGSLELGLPVTSFALLPFVALLVLGRVVARRTETTVLFACATALAYALVVGVLAAFGAASAEGAGEGATIQFAADPLSAAWRAFLLALLGILVGAAVPHGPLLPSRPRQVIRGAFVAAGISLAITVLLTVVLLVVQGGNAPAPQLTGESTQLAPEGSSVGETLAAIGVLFTLLPAVLGTLWLFAHGLPTGLHGAQDLTSIPLIGPALADTPLQVSLLGNWPGGNAWRLLLLGPIIGLVVGGMLAARGAPQNERWWQGALIAVPYAAFAALAAVLCRIGAEISIAAVTLDLALGTSLPWLLALLPVGGALGALGALLVRRGAVWAPNPRHAFLGTAIVSAVVLMISLPSAIALQPQETSQLLSSTSPTFEPPPPAASPEPKAKDSPSSSSSPPSPASDRQEQKEASETGLRRAVDDYYEAVVSEDWDYTYDNLDSQTQRRFTRSEWIQKNQYFTNVDPLERSVPETISEASTSSPVEVTLTQTFRSGEIRTRNTYFVWEDGTWKHRFSQEEDELFMPGVPFDEFVNRQQEGSPNQEPKTKSKTQPKRTIGPGTEDIECGDFVSATGRPSQYQAQQFFDFQATPEQKARLDEDDDGFACDDLGSGRDTLGATP